MCIIAMQNAVAGATNILGKNHEAVRVFHEKGKYLKDARDMLTHFEDYALDEGKLQKSPDAGDRYGPWFTEWGSGETLTVWLNRSGSGEKSTPYPVPIHETLRSVATLVAAALESVGKQRSELIERLTPEG